MSIDKILYAATATATGGREGRAQSSDRALDVQLSTPRELGGGGGPGTNPEQLFAAGYAACFENAMLRAARQRKDSIAGTSITAAVGIGRLETGRFALTVSLTAKVPGVERSVAEELVRVAHEEICPYSHATRGNIDVTVQVA